MGARKLQAEIERTLKKVSEGVDEFEEIWQKVYTADKPNLKEKWEAELKKEIKKLQRYRDQIKTWISSSEIKDKKPLIDARKLIEKDMERFKVCEKETKTKAYSKEALAAPDKKDPEISQDKLECKEWIDDFAQQIKDLLAEREAEFQKFNLGGGGKGKKGKKSDKEQFSSLSQVMEKYNWHLSQLSRAWKLLAEDKVSLDSINLIKDDLEYWIDNHQMEDVDDSYFYDVIDEPLEDVVDDDEEEDEDDTDPPTSVKDEDDSKSSKSGAASATEAEAGIAIQVSANYASGAAPASKPARSRDSLPDAAAAATILVSKPSVPPVSSSGSAKKEDSEVHSVSSDVKSDSQAPVKLVDPSPFASVVKRTPAALPSSGIVTSETSPATVAIAAAKAKAAAKKLEAQPEVGEDSPRPKLLSRASAGEVVESAWKKDRDTASMLSSSHTDGDTDAKSAGPTPALSKQSSIGSSVSSIDDRVSEKDKSLEMVESGSREPRISILKSHPPELRPSIHSRPKMEIPARLQESLEQEHIKSLRSLEASLKNIPEIFGGRREKSYVPSNPCATPEYFPSSPAPIFDDHRAYERFDTDTLFFIFYFQQGTQQQYWAARQLKRQSWRYHTKYLTWFQRHDDPKVTTDEYEQGTYVYFDHDASWCQRIKTDFRFEYVYLEDELPA